MHQKSVSATGKFGFHISTCYTKIAQAVDSWEGFWCVLYPKHLDHVMDVAKSILERPQFDMLCNFTLEKIVPGLLLPLQSEGRVLKPCLIHGDCGMEIQLWILELGRLLYSMSVLSTVIMPTSTATRGASPFLNQVSPYCIPECIDVSLFTGILQLLKDPLARSLAGLGFHSFDCISAPEAPYMRTLNHAP
jgi:hypothetical protein